MNTLKAIEMCVRRCGARVHNEIAKFRFLNQIVRLLSPKYNGEVTSAEVKAQAIEMLFVWQKSMRHLTKFKQVYDMLKEQKVILEDPEVSDLIRITPPCRLATFEDEEKANLLSQLLKSNNPEDLQAANRLIKSMVRSEEQKMERLHKRIDDVEKANNNCRVLNEILAYCNTEPMSEREGELAAELYTVLVEMRPSLFRYAGEAAEYDDAALADILAVNDAVNKAVEQYKNLFPDHKLSAKTSPAKELVSVDYSRNRNGSSLSTSKAASSRGSHVSIVDLLCNDPEANAVDMTNVIDRDALRAASNVNRGSSPDVALICISSSNEQGGRERRHTENDSSSSALDDLSLLLDQSVFSSDTAKKESTAKDDHSMSKGDIHSSLDHSSSKMMRR
uniref:ADP-ribosylation factor-binding protein GGA1 n=1 Tax=Parascaris univalens TaxID=6257 RepID=A0A914ZKB6_PARUN